MKDEILLVPVGTVPPEVCDWLAGKLPLALNCVCHIAPALPHPLAAWDARRRQYQADSILAQVQRSEATCALGIADLDLYVRGLNFVFGLADRGRRRAIIALPRLRQSFYSLPEDEGLFRERVMKEAMHELGHVLGLNHCADAHCVMHFSNTLADTDYKHAAFCQQCSRTLGRG